MAYTKQLEAMDSLVHPHQLFTDTDALLKTYDSLKRDYCREWNKYERYQTQTKLLSSQTSEQTSITVSVQEIDTFIYTMRLLQSSLRQCLSDIAHTSRSDHHHHLKRSLTLKSCKKKREYKTRLSSSLTSDFASISETPPIMDDDSDEKELSDKPQNSIRSFGALFSKEFQLTTVTHYKHSIAPKHFFPSKKDDIQDERAMAAEASVDSTTSKQIKVVQYFHDNYYGQNEVFESPFGLRPVIYCDWTASGKS
eukprot:354102_1